MINLYIQDEKFEIQNSFGYKKSSREVTINEVEIDFSGKTLEQLPTKYQQVELWDGLKGDGKRLFTGYVLDYTLPELVNNWSDRTLKISLVSPYEMTTLRTTTVIGTDLLSNTLLKVIDPLLNDGFTIGEISISDKNVTVGYSMETIETCLNDLSNKNNLWWYINENKEIFVFDLDYKFSMEPKQIYNGNNFQNGLYSITPSMDATDYCNVVNFKNVRIYTPSLLDSTHSYNPLLKETPTLLKKGDTIDFRFPFDITIANIQKSINDNDLQDDFYGEEGQGYNEVFVLKLANANGDIILHARIIYDGEKLSYTNIKFDGDENTDGTPILLKRDSMFNNLITGFIYNAENNLTISSINQLSTCSGLQWAKYKYINIEEVEKSKGKISESGQIEKTIDLNESWRTEKELQQMAESYININKSQSDEVQLKTDEGFDYDVGDIIRFNSPDFCLVSDYIVTDIEFEYEKENAKSWTISIRNKNYLANFIDTFRGSEFEKNKKEENYVINNYIGETISERRIINGS